MIVFGWQLLCIVHPVLHGDLPEVADVDHLGEDTTLELVVDHGIDESWHSER